MLACTKTVGKNQSRQKQSMYIVIVKKCYELKNFNT